MSVWDNQDLTIGEALKMLTDRITDYDRREVDCSPLSTNSCISCISDSFEDIRWEDKTEKLSKFRGVSEGVRGKGEVWDFLDAYVDFANLPNIPENMPENIKKYAERFRNTQINDLYEKAKDLVNKVYINHHTFHDGHIASGAMYVENFFDWKNPNCDINDVMKLTNHRLIGPQIDEIIENNELNKCWVKEEEDEMDVDFFGDPTEERMHDAGHYFLDKKLKEIAFSEPDNQTEKVLEIESFVDLSHHSGSALDYHVPYSLQDPRTRRCVKDVFDCLLGDYDV